MPHIADFGSCLIVIITLSTKTNVAPNEVALSYYRVRGLYILAVSFCGHMERLNSTTHIIIEEQRFAFAYNYTIIIVINDTITILI